MTRKTKTALITVCLLLTVTVVYALAAAGGASDPLASLSYLTGTFTDAVDQRVEEKLDASDQALLNGDAAPSDGGAATWMETRLKAGDALTGSTGTGVLLLAGGMQVTFNSGAVVDVTTGTTVTSGSALTASHRYLVAEETTAVFTVTSKTAVVDYQGPYAFSYSTNTDYNAIAAALKTMHLFQGSFTGYGDGYDLEVAPTRLQALIMFIRVLGEENDALAYTGSTPFTDITPGTQSEKYVGYAYSKGYTNGYSATTFRPSQPIHGIHPPCTGIQLRGQQGPLRHTDQCLDQWRHHGGRAGRPAGRHVPPGGSRIRLLLRAGCCGVRQQADTGRHADGQGRLHRAGETGGRRTRHQRPEIKPEPLCRSGILWIETGSVGLRFHRRFRYVQ